MFKLATTAAILIALSLPAIAKPPPPAGFYGFFREPQVSCPTAASVVSVFEAIKSVATRDEFAAVMETAVPANDCAAGYVPGPFAVGESVLLGTITIDGNRVDIYSVNVGTSDLAWWVLYGDADKGVM
jgi:hypothetical protein